jgi:hypothetical protein
MQPPLSHFTSPDFWSFDKRLQPDVQRMADKYFGLLDSNPKHPSIHLKKIGKIWSVRAGLHYRAVGMDAPSSEKGILWIWIVSHAEYDRFIRGM